MGFLILTVSDGLVHSVRAALGDGVVKDRVFTVAQRFGLELKPDGHRRSFEERRAWPLTVTAYTSFDRRGRGRSGSSLYSYPARRLPCGRCAGRGSFSNGHMIPGT